MDLKVKDVAHLLNVSETTIRRWAADEKIPYYKIDGEYRFNPVEVESWVIHHKVGKGDKDTPFSEKASSEEEKRTLGSQTFSLFRALHKGSVLGKVSGNSKESIIRISTKQLGEKLRLDSEVLAELLLDREKLQPTALNNGIAVPHARDFVLSPMHDVVAFAFLDQPIAYGALDGEDVHTLIFLFACNDKRHLHLLAKIAHLSSQKAAQDFFKKKPSKEALLAFVQEWEGKLRV